MASFVLPRSFYGRHPAIVARELVGKRLVRLTPDGLCGGRIVETEAYLSSRDPACHANRGMTPRNAAMFGPAGHAYVYMIHAKWCFNCVTEDVGLGSAVLIRAIEPLVGLPLMHARRGKENVLDLTRGPARLCQALAIDRSHNTHDLTAGSELWIEHEEELSGTPLKILRSPRIGISAATNRLLRFYLAGNRYVSGRRLMGARYSVGATSPRSSRHSAG
jgi:DNA-3-methyladenine glycosylase